MFGKLTGKEVKRFIICLITYLVLAFAAAFTGFLGPLFWVVVYPVVGAFLEAGPITYVMNMKRGFGSAAVLPLILFILCIPMGEITMTLMAVWFIVVIILSEVVHMAVGCNKLSSIRVAAPIGALLPLGQIFPLYFTKEAYLEQAALEMDADYVEGLRSLGSIPLFLLTLVLCIVAGVLSERLTEKLLNIKN